MPTPPRRPIRLVCLDVDGTLVDASGAPHPRVWEAAERTRAWGIRLAVCSGRPGFGVTRALASRIEASGLHCLQNGASIVDFNGGRSLSSVLPGEVVADLVARARRSGHALELYTDGDYAVEVDGERPRRHAALLGVPFEPRPFEALVGDVVRAQWVLAHDEARVVIAEPHPGLEISPSLAPSMPDTTFVNLTRAGVDKGSAMRTIAEAYGIALEAVMYVGDGANDVPALRIAGWPVVVDDAEAVARALARTVVPGSTHGGVADALELAMRSWD